MIDFKELPDDGLRFEQLFREIFLRQGLQPKWTGKGPDQGRDIILAENARGLIKDFNRKWLVQCKHKAHSGKSVGSGEIIDIIDNCKQINAKGFMLVCSTEVSSALQKKFDEIIGNDTIDIEIEVWDGVKVETILSQPEYFGLCHIFFPKSMKETPWKVYNMDSPSSWAAKYKEYFLYLDSRSTFGYPSLIETEKIIKFLENVPLGENEHLRIRGVFFDTKNWDYFAHIDYIVNAGKKPSLTPKDMCKELEDGIMLKDNGEQAYFCITVQEVLPYSDYFDLDDAAFYKSYPHSIIGDTGTISQIDNWLVKTPPIRSFSDRLMFDKSDEEIQ